MNEKMSRLESQIENGKYKGDDINRLEAEYNSEKGAHLDRENEKRFQKRTLSCNSTIKTALTNVVRRFYYGNVISRYY